MDLACRRPFCTRFRPPGENPGLPAGVFGVLGVLGVFGDLKDGFGEALLAAALDGDLNVRTKAAALAAFLSASPELFHCRLTSTLPGDPASDVSSGEYSLTESCGVA